jgi:hypothetical protein
MIRDLKARNHKVRNDAMKAKLGGLGGIKQFFIMHGEKLGVGLIALVALWFIYGALGRESLPADKAASKLNERITLARQNMDGFTWSKYKESAPEQVRTVVPLSQTGSREITAEKYLGPNPKIPWDAPVVPPIVLRTDPVLLEAQDLESHGDSGLLAFVDPAVRRQKMREEAEKVAAREKKQREESARTTEDTGRSARGSRGGEAYGAGDVFDPEHPKRRPVVGMVRPAGVPLEGYEDVRIGYWAVVNAKIPIKEQVKLYREVFENARGYDPASDLPQYLGYFVERLEIRPGDEIGDLNWENAQKVGVYDGKSSTSYGSAFTAIALYGKGNTSPDQVDERSRYLTRDWVPGLGEIVDPRFMGTGPLVFPLPPLVGRDWSREATHTDIPLASDNFELEEEKQPETQPEEKAEGEPTDMFAGAAGGMAAGGRGAYGMDGGARGGARGGYGTAMRGEMGMGGMGMRGGARGGFGMERGGYGGEMGGRGGMSSGAAGSGFGPDGTPLVSDWLLRFFDFSVEPGKKYKYRVQLVLLDPNQTSSSRFVGAETLDSSVLNRIKENKKTRKSATPYRMTEWSKPSSTVTIPLAGSVYVVESKPASDQITSEPKATLLVQSFAKDAKGNAIQAAEEKEFQRGHVANMTTKTEIVVDQNRAIEPYKDFPFETDITVADIRGGERLTRKDSRPARVLLMGPAGQLFIQDEIRDAEVVANHEATFAKEPPGGGGGFMGGRGFGGPEGMMRRGQ